MALSLAIHPSELQKRSYLSNLPASWIWFSLIVIIQVLLTLFHLQLRLMPTSRFPLNVFSIYHFSSQYLAIISSVLYQTFWISLFLSRIRAGICISLIVLSLLVRWKTIWQNTLFDTKFIIFLLKIQQFNKGRYCQRVCQQRSTRVIHRYHSNYNHF